MDTIVAAAVAAVGALLMSWSVLLYESDERTISAALASWWIKIDDIAVSTTRKNRLLISDSASAVVGWLDDIFGAQLVSLHGLAVSVCLSFSSIFAFASVVAFVDPTPDPNNPIIVAACFPLNVILFNVSVGRGSRRVLPIVALSITGVVMAVVVLGFLYSPFPWRIVTLPAGIMLGMCCDFVVIVIARRLVLAATRSVTLIRSIGLIGGSVSLGALMLSAPVLVLFAPKEGFDPWQFIGALAGLTNLYAGVVAAAFAVVNLMFVVQKALWPVIERPLYAVERFSLFQKRRALFCVGASLLAFAAPVVARTLLRALTIF